MNRGHEIHNEPCDCPKGGCRHFVEPDSECINRLAGDVRTLNCKVCSPAGTGATWHQDGECVRCRVMGR